MNTIQRVLTLTLAIASAIATSTVSAQANDYPNRPIRIVVPFPAGGPTDILARVVGLEMSEQLNRLWARR